MSQYTLIEIGSFNMQELGKDPPEPLSKQCCNLYSFFVIICVWVAWKQNTVSVNRMRHWTLCEHLRPQGQSPVAHFLQHDHTYSKKTTLPSSITPYKPMGPFSNRYIALSGPHWLVSIS